MPTQKQQKYMELWERTRQRIYSTPFGKKIDCAGVYQIKLDGKLVYIGKADNMLNRLTDHYLETFRPQPREHKYKILREAKMLGHNIQFSVLYYATNTRRDEIEEEICIKEGELIRANLPPLNYKIPLAENYRCFNANLHALTITLQELLEL